MQKIYVHAFGRIARKMIRWTIKFRFVDTMRFLMVCYLFILDSFYVFFFTKCRSLFWLWSIFSLISCLFSKTETTYSFITNSYTDNFTNEKKWMLNFFPFDAYLLSLLSCFCFIITFEMAFMFFVIFIFFCLVGRFRTKIPVYWAMDGK